MDFFEKQSELTAAKIDVYKEYITRYLPKVLITFKNCLIVDLFCGAGKNGEKNGSPLVLIEQVKLILSSPRIKGSKVELLFNDKDPENSRSLALNLQGIFHQSIVIHDVKNLGFQTILKEIIEEYKSNKTAKFFFLDPFTYSDVTIDNLRGLMKLPNTEVFLFIPIWDSYRFASSKQFPPKHKTRVFVEEFTTKGMGDYAHIDEFMQSVKAKLRSELKLNYVRPVLLDDGCRKNAVFLLTKHWKGMLEMNKVALKKSNDGKGVKVKHQKQPDLFDAKDTCRFTSFSENFEKELKVKGAMSNEEIVKFVVAEEFLPKHAKSVLIELRTKNKIKVFKKGEDITIKHNQWNIAEKISKEVTFSYDN